MQQCAPCGNRRAKIVTDDRGNFTKPKRPQQRDGISHQIEQMERADVAVIAAIPAGGAPKPTLIRRDYVKARRRQRRQHLAPTESQLRKSVQ
jgi:hypothetical protein